MDNLKLTTLTMLIPLGWAMSVDAYPQPLEELGDIRDFTSGSRCEVSVQEHPPDEISEQYPGAPTDAIRALRGSPDTSTLHPDRTSQTDTCGLVLDQIDIN